MCPLYFTQGSLRELYKTLSNIDQYSEISTPYLYHCQNKMFWRSQICTYTIVKIKRSGDLLADVCTFISFSISRFVLFPRNLNSMINKERSGGYDRSVTFLRNINAIFLSDAMIELLCLVKIHEFAKTASYHMIIKSAKRMTILSEC